MGCHYHSRYQRLSWGFLSVDEVLTDQDPSVVNEETINDCILRMRSVHHTDQGGVPIIFDTGATIDVTPFAEDFESWEHPEGDLVLSGITEGADVKGLVLFAGHSVMIKVAHTRFAQELTMCLKCVFDSSVLKCI